VRGPKCFGLFFGVKGREGEGNATNIDWQEANFFYGEGRGEEGGGNRRMF